MKKLFLFSILIFGVLCVGIWQVYAMHPWLGKTMSVSQVKKKWGEHPFDMEQFKNGDVEARAKMAYALINSKKLLGLNASEVRAKLGDFDGHYFSESYPTYLIQIAKSQKEESWQLVFLIDDKKRVKEIIVHKNCCD